MTETAALTRFVAIPRTAEHGGYENECYTHYVQDNGGRYCLRGPMVQSDYDSRCASSLAENRIATVSKGSGGVPSGRR
ncbi:hypothetical protein R4P70_32280 [Rhodococcus sp. IEGM 1241]|uniref:hypothetical protein n=1 Tax=Rhodococcus sp. IEGM 1241 TaxID=3082228 RepID=UPI0029541839|nr:hypothetical protein [Rhodococcus sp. IEGM 1241]MDV8015992.1 hypothetical protein [Rhodococcus sp. IEGM 1241]